MKFRFFAFMLVMSLASRVLSQMEFAGMCADKRGNFFIGGAFESVIDCGNKNLLKSSGNYDMYISKYNGKGQCLWAASYGDTLADNAAAIACDANGNSYLTGSFSGQTRFNTIKIHASAQKTYKSPNFYLVKFNVSGDPVWVKHSKNRGRDDGYALTTDESGNVYVAGTFEDKLQCDDQSVTSSGKTDLFIMKLTPAGRILWLKNYGGQEENGCNAIAVSKGNVLVSSSESGMFGVRALLYALNGENGEMKWSKTIGANKGRIEGIAIDNAADIIVTGYIENARDTEHRDLYVAKFTADGTEKWARRYAGNSPCGSAVTCDDKRNIFLTGSFIDTLRAGKYKVNGYPNEDIFFGRFNADGMPLGLMSTGNSKSDEGRNFICVNQQIFMAGVFTHGLTFDKHTVKGGPNSVFLAAYNSSKNAFEDLHLLVQEVSAANHVRFTNIFGKLLLGKGDSKEFLVEQDLYLEDENGAVIKRTMTDENGDFSFKNVDAAATMNLVLDKNDKLKETDEIFLASQNGVIVDKIVMKDRKFKYPLIGAVMVQMKPLEEEDVSMRIRDFKTSGGKEFKVTERISYEANSWTVPPEAQEEINKLATFMKQNQSIKVEISSYTDALGDDDYNMRLSQMRADQIREFLTKKGISYTRITTKGFGETGIINRCTNNVSCSEQEHSYNRRVEFRFYRGSGL